MNPFISIKGLKKLHQNLSSKVDLSPTDLKHILKKARFKKIKRGEIIIKAGETENYISYIADGILRTYFEKEDKEICLEFFFEGDFTGSLASFLTRQPSYLYQEALTNATLIQVSYDDLQKLYVEMPKMERIGRMLTEEVFMKSSEKVIELLSMSAIERYEKLVQQYPKYYQNIPQKLLASYLNITPESLSRIRKNI